MVRLNAAAVRDVPKGTVVITYDGPARARICRPYVLCGLCLHSFGDDFFVLYLPIPGRSICQV